MRLGLLLIRLMLGITFTIHGSQKVFSGFKEPMEMMSGLGFPAFLGIILGLFSNYVAAGFIVIMLGALFTVHLSQGYMASELVILLLVMSIAVMVSYNWKKLLEIY